MLLLLSGNFFQNQLFKKNLSETLVRVSSSLDPDQGRHSFGPDLDPNCLQRLSADGKSHLMQGNI